MGKFDDIRQEIADEGGITTLPMWRLRNAAGWDKLGVHVVRDIATKMDRAGLATLPKVDTLPYNQDATVRVYVKDSRVGEVIKAVERPSYKGDKLLRDIGLDDASEVLQRIRQMLGEEP